MNALLPINKPVGLSTFDLIRHFKKANSPDYKVGHAGTLDVFADGLVILLLGSATKSFADFQQHQKTYLATSRLGYSTATLDIEGDFIQQLDPPHLTRESIASAIETFPKKYDQTVPAFSAAKHQGQPLYKHALKGQAITKSKPVEIYQLELLAYKNPLATIKATVSSGTYIRQLSVDIFKTLHIESFLTNLTRTQIGPFDLHAAATLEDVYNDNWKQYQITQ